jgi:FixJ family two-component response regulator/glycine cleavage system H lipoate-binding protein
MSADYDLLVIDDEQVIIDAVIRICSVEQLKVDAALDAQSAIIKAEKNSHRLIICDIMLPGMDGFQFLAQVKALGITTPLIMTTGYSTIENAVKSLYQGAIDFLPKPFTADEFCSAIKRGFKYREICEKSAQTKTQDNENSILYVPPPAKYFKLGYGTWVTQEHSGSILVGITDLFLKTIDFVEEIYLLEKEQEIFQGSQCAMLKTKDGMQHGILSPISGRIIEKNRRIESEITLIEKDPYFNGWLYRVVPTDLAYQMEYLIPCGSEEP